MVVDTAYILKFIIADLYKRKLFPRRKTTVETLFLVRTRRPIILRLIAQKLSPSSEEQTVGPPHLFREKNTRDNAWLYRQATRRHFCGKWHSNDVCVVSI